MPAKLLEFEDDFYVVLENANTYKIYFYSAIVVDYARAVANSTRGPGRNLTI
jgi:hypothetical protein